MDMVARSLMSRSKLASSESGSRSPKHFFQLGQILHRVPPLPQRSLPLLLADVLVPGQTPPIRLDKFTLQRVMETAVRQRALSLPASRWAARAWFRALPYSFQAQRFLSHS